MPCYVALLRAVNLGSHNKISMTDLKKVAEDAGCLNARTLLNSSNLVLDCDVRSGSQLEARLEQAFTGDLGITTPVIVRSAAEWRKVVEANLFKAEAKD